MAEQTIEWYPYEKRPWYPHMMPEDKAVWERFLEKNPDFYERCAYDVRVGKVPEFVTSDPENDIASMEALYKKKIDVLAESDGVLDLIELKPVCGMSTIGQVKGYTHFFKRDWPGMAIPVPVVICGAATDDVREFAEAEGVAVVVV